MVSNFSLLVQQRHRITVANQRKYYKTKTRVINNLINGNESSNHDVRKCVHLTPVGNYIKNQRNEHEQ